MFDLGDAYYVKTLTDKGEELAKAAGLEAGGDAEAKAAAKQGEESLAKVKRSIDTAGIPEHLPALYDDKFWEQFSDRCLGCGICTFLCPTCHCFDIQDEVRGFRLQARADVGHLHVLPSTPGTPPGTTRARPARSAPATASATSTLTSLKSST